MKINAIRLDTTDEQWISSQSVNKSAYVRGLIRAARGKQEREETLREAAERIVRELVSDLQLTQAQTATQGFAAAQSQTAEERLQAKAQTALEKLMGR